MTEALTVQTLLLKKSPTTEQRLQLSNLLRTVASDLPEATFQNAYLLYKANPKTSYKYLQLEDIIYSGLQLRVQRGTMRKWVMHLKKQLGDNAYVRRIMRFVQYVTSDDKDLSPMQNLLQDDRSDNETLKKIITNFKRSGKTDQYIQRLNKYLSIEPLDQEAWLELAELYTQKNHFMKAAFCYEQLIVLCPTSDVYTLKLSELYLTLNSKPTTQKAIKYLTYLVTKRPDNLRALWVLYRVTQGNQEYQQLREMCSDVINKMYSQKNPQLKIHVAL